MCKVGLCGSAGTGRSAIAMGLAERIEVPFLPSRSITQPILQRDGYDYSSGVFVEKFLSDGKRELELIRNRITRETELDGFVTDRTTVDHFAYLLMDVGHYKDEDVATHMEMCRLNAKKYTHLFFFPWQNRQLQPNNLRTLNRWFQMSVDVMIRGLLETWDIKTIVVPEQPTIEFFVDHIK